MPSITSDADTLQSHHILCSIPQNKQCRPLFANRVCRSFSVDFIYCNVRFFAKPKKYKKSIGILWGFGFWRTNFRWMSRDRWESMLKSQLSTTKKSHKICNSPFSVISFEVLRFFRKYMRMILRGICLLCTSQETFKFIYIDKIFYIATGTMRHIL